MMDLAQQRVLVTGGRGFLGRAIAAALRQRGALGSRVAAVGRRDFDLTDARQADAMLSKAFTDGPPDVIIHAAAISGGVGFNREHPARLFSANSIMALHLVDAVVRAGLIERGVRVVMVASMCAYPADAATPMREDDLFNGRPAEPTAPYGLAKRVALEALWSHHREFGLLGASVILSNLYGPGANFDPASANVVATMIDRFLDAKARRLESVVCWGSGRPTRDFLFIEDAADGVIRAAARLTDPAPVNLGSGCEVSIERLARTVARLVGYRGRIEWDDSKPDGAAAVCADISRAGLLLEWSPRTPLEEGLWRTIEWRRDAF